MPDQALSRKRRWWGRTVRFTSRGRLARRRFLSARFPALVRIVSSRLPEVAGIHFTVAPSPDHESHPRSTFRGDPRRREGKTRPGTDIARINWPKRPDL